MVFERRHVESESHDKTAVPSNSPLSGESKRLLVIEKSVPLPPKMEKQTKPLTFVMQAMEIGDSILVPHENHGKTYRIAKRSGIKVTTRRQVDGTVRVWRVQ